MRGLPHAAFSCVTVGVIAFCAGCSYIPNFFQETGPSTEMAWDSPSAAEIKSRNAPAPERRRDTPAVSLAPQRGVVYHSPLYFEDPFVDKGHGRTDETDPRNVWRGGWEDYVALPYSPTRFVGNILMLPISAIVTPPVVIQESDGRLSKQLLGYDHDAESVGFLWTEPEDLKPLLGGDRETPRTEPGTAGTPTGETKPQPTTAPASE